MENGSILNYLPSSSFGRSYMPDGTCLLKHSDVVLHAVKTHFTLKGQFPDADGWLSFKNRENCFFGVSLVFLWEFLWEFRFFLG